MRVQDSKTTAFRFSRSVPVALRRKAANAVQPYCQMCGISSGEIDSYTGRGAKFRVDLIRNNGLGGGGDFSELRVLCSTCHRGAQKVATPKPTAIWLLSQVRRSGMQEQMAVIDWLSKKFARS